MRAATASFAAAAVVFVIAACGSSDPGMNGKTPTGARVSCTSDSDCTITTSGGCCACCPSEPHAVPVESSTREQNKCASMDCKGCSDSIQCPKTAGADGFVAKCQQGTCARVAR